MNILSFTYTKSNGEVSKRVISPSIVPSKKFEGIDLSALIPSEQIRYCQEYSKLQDEFHAKILELQAEFDVENKYRCFFPEKMTNVVAEAV